MRVSGCSDSCAFRNTLIAPENKEGKRETGSRMSYTHDLDRYVTNTELDLTPDAHNHSSDLTTPLVMLDIEPIDLMVSQPDGSCSRFELVLCLHRHKTRVAKAVDAAIHKCTATIPVHRVATDTRNTHRCHPSSTRIERAFVVVRPTAAVINGAGSSPQWRWQKMPRYRAATHRRCGESTAAEPQPLVVLMATRLERSTGSSRFFAAGRVYVFDVIGHSGVLL